MLFTLIAMVILLHKKKMILKPLGRQWFFQLRHQIAVKYIYLTDTAGYKGYVDPEEHFHKKIKSI